MKDTLDKYLKRKVKECNYYIICDNEEYSNSIGNANKSDIYKLNNFTFTLVVNTLISLLISEEKIFLHDKLNKYINNYSDDILIIHLLTHSSGINSSFKPGTNVEINNINCKLLIDIIEKIYNDDIEVIANKYIFEPLDMKSTKIDKYDIKTNIIDISKFIKFILNNGYFNKKYILDVKYIDIWFSPLFISTDDLRMTIGWINGSSSYLCKNINCSINTIVYFDNNYLLVDKDNDLSIILFFNDIIDNNIRNDINKYIYRLLKKYNKIY